MSGVALSSAPYKLYEERSLFCFPRQSCHRCWCILSFVFLGFAFGLLVPAPKNPWYQLVRNTNNTMGDPVTIVEMQYLTTKTYRVCEDICYTSSVPPSEYGSALDTYSIPNVSITQGLQGLSFVYGSLVFFAVGIVAVILITPAVKGSPERIRKKQLEKWENLITQGIQPSETDVPIQDGRYHYLMLFLCTVLGTALGFHATVEMNRWIYTPIITAIRNAKTNKYIPIAPYSPSKELLLQYEIMYGASYSYLMFGTICGIICSCAALLTMACAFKWLCCVSRDSFRTPPGYEIEANLRRLRNPYPRLISNNNDNSNRSSNSYGQFIVHSPLQPNSSSVLPPPPPPPPSSSSFVPTDEPTPPPGIRSQRANAYVLPNHNENGSDEEGDINPSAAANNNRSSRFGTPLSPSPPLPAVPNLSHYRHDDDRNIVTIPVPWSPYVPPNLAPLNPYIAENEITYTTATPDINSLYSNVSDYHVPSTRIVPPRVVSPFSFSRRSNSSSSSSTTTAVVPSTTSTASLSSGGITDGDRFRSRYDRSNDTTINHTSSSDSSRTISNRNIFMTTNTDVRSSVVTGTMRNPTSSSLTPDRTNSNSSSTMDRTNTVIHNPFHPSVRTTSNNTRPTTTIPPSSTNRTSATNNYNNANDDDDDFINVMNATAVNTNDDDDDEVPTSGPDYSYNNNNNSRSPRTTNGGGSIRPTGSSSPSVSSSVGSSSRTYPNTLRTNTNNIGNNPRSPFETAVPVSEEIIEDDDPT